MKQSEEEAKILEGVQICVTDIRRNEKELGNR